MPIAVSIRYKRYCKITNMKLSEPLRVLVLQSIPQLHNAKNLNEIIKKTKQRDLKADYDKYYVRLPEEAMNQINTYCKFFNLNWRRCHFLYFLIEAKLLELLEDILDE